MVPWLPTYPSPKDKRVELTECEVQTYISNRRPVIALSGYPLASPACFWTDSNHIYLRINWEKWCTVTPSNPGNAAVLCDSRYCQITMTVDNEITEETAPVYHVAKLPPELFAFATAHECSPESRKQKAISDLADAVPDDLDAMAFKNVNLNGENVDLVVSSDDDAILFAVFPKEDDYFAGSRNGDSSKSEADEIAETMLDDLIRSRENLGKMEPYAKLRLAIIASSKTLASMRCHWLRKLNLQNIKLVEYEDYERFLRRHLPQRDDDDQDGGDDEE